MVSEVCPDLGRIRAVRSTVTLCGRVFDRVALVQVHAQCHVTQCASEDVTLLQGLFGRFLLNDELYLFLLRSLSEERRIVLFQVPWIVKIHVR